ncbi:MAG: aminopeptidase P family protein [Acetobacteraceae bacterium]|nr:aminopeptidase P family protein [Acetobacteraceae bacterium]MDW8397889.1 aminopeptidase P family protein [Acetobacteraceae bacterium]
METFENVTTQRPDHAARLAALRAELTRLGVDGLLVPRADEHLGEYVPPSAERLAWLSGFTGSAGLGLVLPDRAVLFTDGRYTVQAAQQTDPTLWQRAHITETPPHAWLAEHAPGLRIGYDPWLHTEAALARFAAVTLVPLAANPVDAIWHDRPAPPAAPAIAHPLAFAGRPAEEKRAEAAAALAAAKEDAAVLADPHAAAWLLNLRGGDLAHTPLCLAMAILHADGRVALFADPAKFGPEVRAHLGAAVAIAPRAALPDALDSLAGRTVRCDPDRTPAAILARLRAAGARVTANEDPTVLPRARKNAVEQQGARAAHRRDAAAMARFLAWFAAEAPKGGLTEMAAAERLRAFRAEAPEFRGESFPAIAGAGEHGAIVHYRATPDSDRPIRPGEPFLIDSGAQYPDGTTDITRTLWVEGAGDPPAELVERATRVLKGHLALAALRFPEGVAGPHLDAIARAPLWQAGLDYDHGTGHGVGSFLSVHEGPAAFSRAAKPVPLGEGMILSDEPGFYEAGRYGIRIENLLLVRREPGTARPFLCFETLTLVPYDRRLIAPGLLSPAERAQVDAYHARVRAEIGPLLDAAARAWLEAATAPL